jgi:dethiobiotin synthetase
MENGLFLVGTDRGVGKTMVGAALVGLLREKGIDAVLMTPISTGGAVESSRALLKAIGVEDTLRNLTHPVGFETLAAPYVASQVEQRPVDVQDIIDAYTDLVTRGKFVVVEGGGALVPITRYFSMIDLLKAFNIPAVIVGRSSRGTLNHCLLTLRMMLVMGEPPIGFILNGYGQFGEGFAESLNADTLSELAPNTPVLANLEWRPAYQDKFPLFLEELKQQPVLMQVIEDLLAVEPRSKVVSPHS